jgi:SET domain-containing protein
MLTIKTAVRSSPIHGNGVFAAQKVLPGETVWEFAPLFDRVITDHELASSPEAFRDFLDMYAYRSTDMDGALILSCDNARFLNHSSFPNTRELPFRSVATRVIEIGEEVTCDYGAFCSDELEFKDASIASTTEGASGPPHRNLYTRIKACSLGVGVFAIRDIPKGVNPFLGDVGHVINVPVSEVNELKDDEVRRMYFDFCPVVDDAFVAPGDFNQLTIGWYVNHSKAPNVSVTAEMAFVATRDIQHGEELTSDYSTYSAHVEGFFDGWTNPV